MAVPIPNEKDHQKEAESLLQMANQIELTNSQNWHHLGVLKSTTNPEQVEPLFRKSLEPNSEKPRTYVDLAMMHLNAERFLDAEDIA
jgi:hypothetical protein